MQNRRGLWWLALVVAMLGAPPVWPGASGAPQRALPELLYTCPMHADVLEDGPGACPICKMKLEPVRIETDFWYACPLHAATLSERPGLCPLDKRQKMPVVVTVHWICSQHQGEKLMEPGRCADGSERQEIHQIRAHGDHNPRHGGQFYMAADNWHHVEGTYPRRGLFRAYFYDNFTQPIDATVFTAQLIDANHQPVALKPGTEKGTLEGAVSPETLPLKVALEVTFDKNQRENHFDFQFTDLSKDVKTPPGTAPRSATPTAGAGRETSAPQAGKAARAVKRATPAAIAPVAATNTPVPRSTRVETSVPSAPAAAAATPVSTLAATPTLTSCAANVTRTDVLLLSEALPKDQNALLKLLTMCKTEVQTLIDTGRFGFVYQPTMLGKDIALALEAHGSPLPERQRLQAGDGTRRIVLSAWELDLYGDLGNQQKLTEAFQRFAAAVGEINSAYGTQP